MSEQPQAADPVMSRLRRPASRLRDLPIWSKLGLIMIVPTLATIVVGTSGLVDHINTAKDADRARTLAQLSDVSGALVDNLQNERAFGIMLLGAPVNDQAAREKTLQAYNGVHKAVDTAKRPYSQQRTALNEVPGNLGNLLDRIDANLEELPAVRSQVVNGKLKLSDAAESYESTIADLLAIRESAAQLAGDPALSDQMRAASSLAQMKEYGSLQRIVVHEALSLNAMIPPLRKEYIATQTGQEQALRSFKSVGRAEDIDFNDQTVTGPEVRDAESFTGYLDSKAGESLADAPFDPTTWDAALLSRSNLMRTVEKRLDKQIVDAATVLRDNVQQRVLIETGVLLGMLLLAILFAWLVARSMARSLRELRHGALSVAQYGLPQAVARLRDPSLSSQLSPVQVANQIAEPLPVRSRDEFGQVTEAFNAVHLEAVRTAAEQAVLRASVSTMFVNLARRSQILVDRLIGHLDRLERGEEDPDRLAELFQLDHLATRMRRNDENLLVLAGADSTRIQREPAALIDVLRAAQSEVEHYTRIEFGMIDRDIEVSAHAVNDLVHLVAELFDNATAFSPPESHVMVEARRLGDRALLQVEDRGIGITADQLRDLNERLATPPMVDVAVSRMMGLVVVARLASRHGVKVELRPAAHRGTVADVTLPTTVLVPRALSGRLQQGAATSFDSPAEPQQSPARPSFAAPLALESGPVGGNRAPAQRESVSAQPPGRPFDPNPPLNGGGLLGAGAGAGRSMPAWSDLTGATGSNGTNGRDALPSRPVPNGGDALPNRRSNDPWTVEGEVAAANSGATIPRQIPANPESQLRGPAVPPVSAPPMAPGSRNPVSGVPVSGVPVSGVPVSGVPVSGVPVSGVPVSGLPMSAPPAEYPGTVPPVSAPPMNRTPSVVPPVGPPPPSWPPVAADRDAAATPAVPERLAAALDLTAELPRVRPGAEPTPASAQQSTQTRPAADIQQPTHTEQPTPAQQSAGTSGAGRPTPVRPPSNRPAVPVAATSVPAGQSGRTRYADETMELPIFRELESAWFRTGRSTPKEPQPAVAKATGDAGSGQSSSPVAPPGDRPAAVPADRFVPMDPAAFDGPPNAGANQASRGGPANAGAGLPSRAARTPEPAAGNGANGNGFTAQRFPDRRPGWQTAADDGWRAASAAAEAPVVETTRAGLPKRTPMAQLVPGGVDKASTSVQRRTPEAVRGLLSAYHRGVQRGRTKDHSTNPEDTSGGQQSSQSAAGGGQSGLATGSGQKEHEG